jgi:anti-sigma factor RsiW
MTDDLACIEQVELITEYLEGALPEAEVRRLESHLETCDGCTEYVEQMRTISGSLGGLAGDSISPRTRASLIEAFRERRNA